MTFPPHDHAARRTRALEALGEHGALVLPAAPEIRIGRDTDVPYVPDANLLYLTGCDAPETIVVLAPRAPGGPFILFARERDEELERWTGVRESPGAMAERLGAHAAYPLAELRERLPRLLAASETIHFPFGWGRPDVERALLDLTAAGRRTRQRTGRGPRAIADPGAILDEMRLIKDAAEIARMRAAADVTVQAFREAAAAARSATHEWQVHAAIEYAFRRRGASGPAFPSIVAAGSNATVLHYTANDARIEPNRLLLVDAGATVDHYRADVTRTWAPTGTATAAQRDMHDVVMRAHGAAIDAIRPGATEAEVHRAALAQLLRGMEELGLLTETADAALAAEDERLRARPSESPSDDTDKPQRPAWSRYCPHRISHWLGLEVHDVGDYAVDGRSRRLEPGMLLTLEPGLYVPTGDEHAPAALHGIGIRVEDDVLVTSDGHEVLTAALDTGLSPIA
ncbi:MAG TPA: Xaa-Pro aminopeptidase [Longimicrobiales bacterium]|nr:Xaa-Pro aminopeptidase [Longimicrobiales bacterium]